MSIKSKKGFTIIEVVLVLAIAGLIFLMVFIALPAMQRNQRDTARRNDYGALSAALTQYMNNNNGKLPIENAASGTTTIYLNPKDFVNSSGANSNGDFYEVRMTRMSSTSTTVSAQEEPKVGATPAAATLSTQTNAYTGSANKTGLPATGDVVDQIYVYTNADCSDTSKGYNSPKYNKSKRAFAVFGALESGNGVYCSASNS